MTIAAIIVAAGRGKRAGAGLPKQWRKIAGTSVALHSIAAFTSHPRIDRTILVIHPDDHTQARGIESVTLVQGGATRDASVKAGLEALKDAAPALVLIHDVARPLVSARVIDDVIEALSTHPRGFTLTRSERRITPTREAPPMMSRLPTPPVLMFSSLLGTRPT